MTRVPFQPEIIAYNQELFVRVGCHDFLVRLNFFQLLCNRVPTDDLLPGKNYLIF